MSNIDLKTDDGLRAAAQYVEANEVDDAWRKQLTSFLAYVRNASQSERATREFQQKLWEDNPISNVGMGTINTDAAIEDDDFRQWFAEQSTKELPTHFLSRSVALGSLCENAIRQISTHCTRKPWLKLFRVLAALFPMDFTTLASRKPLRSLGKKMLSTRPYESPVPLHTAIRRRLTEVLGEVDENDLDAVVARLTLPWMLYRYAEAAEPDIDKTTTISDTGEEKLLPLPAARRRKGLTALRGSFPEMLSHLEFVREQPSREDFFNYLRSANPTSKENSIRMIANILRSEFGVIRHDGDRYVLTDRGEAVLDSGDPEDLRDWLLTRILGVDHILVSLSESPMKLEQVDDILQQVNPGWTTNFAPRSIIGWLRSLKLIERMPSGETRLTESGEEWASQIDWEPELLPREDIDADSISDSPPVAMMSVPGIGSVVEQVSQIARFPKSLIESLHAGLWVDDRRHFAILTGLSGSGKTLLARAYANAIVGDEPGAASRRYTLPVQPGWYDPSPLFGYVNPLTRDTYENTPFLEVLLRAVANPALPHVVILDEMNLSHPEQYLAPILSAMETGADLYLHSKGDAADSYFDGVPGRIPYPNNLFLIGTVNMDETTMGLSDKVLDRAFTHEFWDIDLDNWPHWNETGLQPEFETRVRETLNDLKNALEPAKLHFGWRVVDEVVGFLKSSRTEGATMSDAEALDRAIYAKVLPKLRGEDSPRIRSALDACMSELTKHDLPLASAKVKELRSDLETAGSARFWR